MENSPEPHTSTELGRPSGTADAHELATVVIMDEMLAYAPARDPLDALARLGRKPGGIPAAQPRFQVHRPEDLT